MTDAAFDNYEERLVPIDELAVPPVEEQPAVVETPLTRFAADVRAGLTSSPKTLPSMYLYDEIGSSLFEAICHLREYKCTVGEKRLLQMHARELAELFSGDVIFAELGGGNGEKAALLLSEFASRRAEVDFYNIDISSKAIELSAHTLLKYPNIRFHGVVETFQSGLESVARARRQNERLAVFFLGSSIGNFTKPEASKLLQQVRVRLLPGDWLLLGTDLVKPVRRLLLAYDDPQGVTAAFNKNLLARINYELGANFELCAFEHESRWDPIEKRVEMHLVSTRNQRVKIPGAEMIIAFRRGESIRTEYSHKYLPEEIAPWVTPLGFELAAQWVDNESLFCGNLLKAV